MKDTLPANFDFGLEFVEDGFVVSSLKIAEAFGKQHKHVLRDIEVLVQAIEASGAPEAHRTEPKFGLSEYTDPTGRALPFYNLNFEAFAILVGRYTGKRALRFQLAYSHEFRRRGEQLKLAMSEGYVTPAARIAQATKRAGTIQKRLANENAYLTVGQRDALRARRDQVIRSLGNRQRDYEYVVDRIVKAFGNPDYAIRQGDLPAAFQLLDEIQAADTPPPQAFPDAP